MFSVKLLFSIYFINEFSGCRGQIYGFRRDRRRDRVWGEADNKNIFSNLSFICGDFCNDYKLGTCHYLAGGGRATIWGGGS